MVTKRRLTWSLFAWMTLALTGSCLPIWEAREMRARVSKVENRQKETQEKLERTRERLRNQKEKLQTKIQSANEEVRQLRKVLKKARKLLQRNSADLGAELQDTRTQIQKLRGEMQMRLRKLQQDLENFRRDVDERFASGEALPEEADPLFDYGVGKFKGGNYRAARLAFERFRSTFGEDERVDRARMYLGDINFEQGKWASAIFDYRKILQNHAESDLRPEANYKIGRAFVKLGQCDNAKPFFETVTSKFGESDYVGDAEQQLEAIENGQCG